MADSDLDGVGAVFDHAAVVATRIRDLLPTYRDLLGGVFSEGGDNAAMGFRWLALAFPGGGKVEMMEPLGESTFFDSFFRRTSGRGGLHHLTFKVGDIHAALDRLREHGYTPYALNLDDPTWREVFLHPKEAHGTLIQLAQEATPSAPRGRTIDDVLAGNGEYGTGIPSP